MPVDQAERADITGDPGGSAGGGGGHVAHAAPHPAPPPPEPAKPAQEHKQAREPAQGGSERPGSEAEPKQTNTALDDLGGAFAHGAQRERVTAPDQQALANPFYPQNTGGLLKDDAWIAWQQGRAVYDAFFGAFLDDRAIKASIRNVWDQNTAQAAAARYLLSGSPIQALAPTKQGGEQAQAVDAPGLEATADPTNLLGFGGKASMAAAIAAPFLLQGVFGGGGPQAAGKSVEDIIKGVAKPDLLKPQWYMDTMWAAATAMILAGGARSHLRGPLEKVLPGWIGAQRELDQTLAKQNAHQVGIQGEPTPDPGKDWIKSVQSIEAPEPGKVLASGIPEKEVGARSLKELPNGEIIDETRKKLLDAVAGFKKERGIEHPEDLPTSAALDPFTGPEAKYIVSHWRDMEMPYDLKYYQDGERPPVDPRSHADAIMAEHGESSPTTTAYINAVHLTQSLLGHINSGPFHTGQWQSVLRSLIGTNRGTGWLKDQWMHHIVEMLHDQPGVDGKVLYRALEGGPEYDALPALQKSVVDMTRLVYNASDFKARSIGYRADRIANFAPRVAKQPERMPTGMRRPRGGASAPLTAHEAFRHRAIQISADLDEEGALKLVARQAHATVADANKAVQDQVQHYMDQLTDKDAAIPADLMGEAGDPELIRRRQAYLDAKPEAQAKAKGDLTQYVKHLVPEFEDDYFKAVDRHMERQIRSIHAYQAAQMLSQSLARVKSLALGNPIVKFAAYDPSTLTQRQIEQLTGLGYRTAEAPGYGKWLWHPNAAKWIDRAHGTHSVVAGIPGLRELAQMERGLISELMYFPTIHGVNMSERIGSFITAHPMLAGKWLTKDRERKTLADIVAPVGTAIARHGGQDWYTMERDAVERRLRAFRAGVVPPSRAARFGSELMGKLSNALGDPEAYSDDRIRDLGGAQPTEAGGLVKAGRLAKQAHDHHNELFWNQINEFGVMTFEVEKEAALRSRGLDPGRLGEATKELRAAAAEQKALIEAKQMIPLELATKTTALANEVKRHQLAHRNAELWAARRANTWMGHVLPEDWNPVVHEMARLALFAPNWWRTKMELLMPIYRDSGFDVDSQMLKHMAQTEMQTLWGMLFWQKATGNALNLLTSGHMQSGNQPGSKDQIELTLPWTDALPMAWGTKAHDPMTGARRTWENPFARQTKEVERLAGLEGADVQESGDLPSLQDLYHGATHFAADRLSPVVELSMGLANIDLHRSLIDGTPRHLDPTQSAPSINSTLAAAMLVIPGGSDFLYQLQQEAKLEKSDTPWPTVLSQGVKAAMSGLPKAAVATGLSWLLGVNPAFPSAQKTQGTLPSDEMYRMAREEQQQYTQQMQEQSAQTLAGEQSPYAWRKWYHDRLLQHTSTMKHVYQNSPNYVNGTLGMVNRWESLYDQATDPRTGQVDYDKLSALQADFRAKSNPNDLEAMDRELGKNDTKYPMVALYHRTLHAYDAWQQKWASAHGYQIAELSSEAKEYAALAGPVAKERYLASHPGLRGIHQARSMEFERSPQGLMFGLFYDSTAVQRYLELHHETAAQVETAAAAAEGVPTT